MTAIAVTRVVRPLSQLPPLLDRCDLADAPERPFPTVIAPDLAAWAARAIAMPEEYRGGTE